MTNMLGKIPLLIIGMSCALASGVALAKDKVVYHIDDAEHQALKALRNIRNQLDYNPDTDMKVVMHSEGVDMMMTDYKDAATTAPLIAALSARNVTFEVCEITMKRRKLDKDKFMLEADFTPSGVVRLTQLQNQGYAYIKP
ncbi:signal peptide protein [Advenella kashmirensis W13003]|uniref:Signal peptide protein n=1 Tax=Advenella kashmirensis W13003 TaxID=1424334 RepID=V8QYM7_9BURK|nr:DsrE family protein [Advenella kashmirensis]ETF04430.1 signal peptide protein [Advenella kashmirensis W13003]